MEADGEGGSEGRGNYPIKNGLWNGMLVNIFIRFPRRGGMEVTG